VRRSTDSLGGSARAAWRSCVCRRSCDVAGAQQRCGGDRWVSFGSTKQFAPWTGPITATVVPDAGQDPATTYSIIWDGALSAVERTDGAGQCVTAPGETSLDCRLTAAPAEGNHVMVLQNDLTGDVLDSATISITPHLRQRVINVGPTTFTPFKRDGKRDRVELKFSVNKRAYATYQVKNSSGRVIRHRSWSLVDAGNRLLKWGGKNDSGRMVTPNRNYWLRLITKAHGEKKVGMWFKVKAYKAASLQCTAGYSPCLVYHGGADYDCAGGGGNGPYFTKAGVTYRVTGSDPYRLDSDGDGKGCEGGSAGGGGGGGGGSTCTAGYSPCLVYHGGADYDCAGGGANGPYFTKPGVTYRVTGSDPYRLDGNSDGWGCDP
jgi:hypothetical protein